MEYANRLRLIRKAYNLTQAEVAYRIGISPSAYGQIERKAANSSIDTLNKIAEAIGVTLPFLIDIRSTIYIEKNNK